MSSNNYDNNNKNNGGQDLNNNNRRNNSSNNNSNVNPTPTTTPSIKPRDGFQRVERIQPSNAFEDDAEEDPVIQKILAERSRSSTANTTPTSSTPSSTPSRSHSSGSDDNNNNNNNNQTREVVDVDSMMAQKRDAVGGIPNGGGSSSTHSIPGASSISSSQYNSYNNNARQNAILEMDSIIAEKRAIAGGPMTSSNNSQQQSVPPQNNTNQNVAQLDSMLDEKRAAMRGPTGSYGHGGNNNTNTNNYRDEIVEMDSMIREKHAIMGGGGDGGLPPFHPSTSARRFPHIPDHRARDPLDNDSECTEHRHNTVSLRDLQAQKSRSAMPPSTPAAASSFSSRVPTTPNDNGFPQDSSNDYHQQQRIAPNSLMSSSEGQHHLERLQEMENVDLESNESQEQEQRQFTNVMEQARQQHEQEQASKLFSATTNNKQARCMKLLIVLFTLVNVVALAIYIVKPSSLFNQDIVPYVEPPIHDTQEQAITMLRANLTDTTLDHIDNDNDSPQARAYEWAMQDPRLTYYPVWRLTQRFALATIFYAFDGKLGDTTSDDSFKWLSYEYSECEWMTTYKGPTCVMSMEHDEEEGEQQQQQHHPTVIRLVLNNVQTIEPVSVPPEVSLLTYLQEFIIVGMEFSSSPDTTISLEGLLPLDEMTNHLKDLQVLEVSRSNQIDGTIPNEITEFTSLRKLILTYTQISGNLPLNVHQMPLLATLDMEHNQLTGTIPTEWSQAPALQTIWANSNRLTGTLPPELSALDMMSLSLKDNQLTGTLPPEWGDHWHGILELRLERNQLSGVLPDSWENMNRVNTLGLAGNPNITGRAFPTWCKLVQYEVNHFWFDCERDDFLCCKELADGTVLGNEGPQN